MVTTIYKFKYIHEFVSELKSKTFAVIIDESHSSTAGTTMEVVTYALSEDDKDGEKSMADLIEDEIARSYKQDNVSMIAITATPKPATLWLFGSLNEQGKKVAFDLYSMKQAIEEGFIIDVLKIMLPTRLILKLAKSL